MTILYIPSFDLQVEVIVNGIPSSCSSGNCSYTFSPEATPYIDRISPPEGMGGDTITIYGGRFTNSSGNISVEIGGAVCAVIRSDETSITCELGDHAAGQYSVDISIAGVGDVASNDVCFTYLLRVDSVSPVVGNVGGGEVIVIAGMGFVDTEVKEADFIEKFFSGYGISPWFYQGFGVPELRDESTICSFNYSAFSVNATFNPFIVDSFEEFFYLLHSLISDSQGSLDNGLIHIEVLNKLLKALYSFYPMAVEMGDSYCITTRSNLTHLECVTVPHLPGELQLTVRVWDQVYTYSDPLVYLSNESALIDSVYPCSSLVYGDAMVTITGSNFGYSPDDVRVQLGDTFLTVLSANDTYIEARTKPNPPGYYSLLLITPRGVAVSREALYSAVADQNASGSDNSDSEISGDGDVLSMNESMECHTSSAFPVFTYQLEVTSISPIIGSAIGNTRVEIGGTGFHQDTTSVLVDGRYAYIDYIDQYRVEFFTPSLSEVRELMLRMEGYEIGKHCVNYEQQCFLILTP